MTWSDLAFYHSFRRNLIFSVNLNHNETERERERDRLEDDFHFGARQVKKIAVFPPLAMNGIEKFDPKTLS